METFILTNRDSNFFDIDSISFSKELEKKDVFSNLYASNLKPNVENMNKQIRLFSLKENL